MLTMDAQEAQKNPSIRLALSSIVGDEFEVDRLGTGDYASLDTPITLGVERKQWNNLVQSTMDHEIDEQLSRLVGTYDLPVVLTYLPKPAPDGRVRVWEAKSKKRSKTGARLPSAFPYAWFVETLIDWYMRGVLLLPLEGVDSTPLVIASLYDEVKKEEHREIYLPKRLLPNMRGLSLTEKLMFTFPGIGEKLCREFVGHTPVELANAPVEFWKEKLGPVRGASVHRKWRGE